MFNETGVNIRKLIIIGLVSAILVMCIVFTIPLKTVPYQIIETYYETEMKRESHMVNKPYITEEMQEKSKTLFEGSRLTVPSGVYIPFHINKPSAQLVGSFECTVPGGFYIYSSASRIIFERLGNQGTFEISLPEGEYKARFRENVMWSEQVYIHLTMKWTELGQVTRYKETVEYREVPTQVEKQRTVTKYKKVSMWKFIFGY